MKSIYELPYELLIHIYEYNPEHREKMKWVLQDIRYIQYCEVCDKIIMKRIWSWPGCGMICCSSECLNNY
jgi:hypothetical protein